MKRIVILYLSTGAGHRQAALAMREYFDSCANVVVTIHDLADFIPQTLNKALVRSYNLLAKNLPNLWGYLYRKTNTNNMHRAFEEINRIVNKINGTRLSSFLLTESPDYILCTHFLPAQILHEYRRKNKVRWQAGLIMTDYDNHSLLTVEGLDHYFVARSKMKWKLIRRGIPADNIHLSGIPVKPIFYTENNSDNEKNGEKKILILTGGDGIGNPEEIIKIITNNFPKIKVTIITGRNKKLEEKLKKITSENITVLGWTDEMARLMRSADIIISKPGGITVSECVALQKPIIAINPIPGQEDHNVEYILEEGLGKLAVTADDLLYYLQLPPQELARGYENMKENKQAGELIREIVLKSI